MRTFPGGRALYFLRQSNDVNLVHTGDVERSTRAPDPIHPGRYIDGWEAVVAAEPCRLNPASDSAFADIVAEQRGATAFDWIVSFGRAAQVLTGDRVLVRGQDDPDDDDTRWQRLLQVNRVIWPRSLPIIRMTLCEDIALES